MGASPSTLQNFSSSLPSSVEESYDLFLANIWLCGLIVTLSAALIAFSQRKTIKKKYDLYKLSKKLFPDGEDMNTLTHLDMVGRVLKKEGEYPITKGELAHKSIPEFAKTVVDPVSPERGTPEEVDKYWPFLPGLTYDQCADGVHVQLEGDDHKCVLMSSLSYWAFHVNDEVREYAFEAVRKTGTGNHGSYLLLGKNLVVKEAYERMANFFKRKYCSFSASGFLACMNLVANLCPKGGVIFMDEKCHICLRYGGKLTGAKVISFPHQNYEALGKLMKQHRHKYKGRSLLVVDAIYSADGTIANLPAARKLCDEYDTWIVMDEAHSLGSIGATGHGIEEHFNMYGACDFICGVFSKSLSSSGGYVVSNSDIVKSLNVTPGVGFATGPHSFTAASVAKALEIIERDNGKTRAAIDKMRLFYVNELKTVAKAANIIHCGHNVFVSYPHHSAATTVSIEMRKRGYYMSSFLYPSVPLDRSILRLTLNPLMTEEILKGFCKTLGEVHELLVPRLGKEVMYGKHQKKYYDELHGGDEADEEMKTKKEKKEQ